MPSAAIPDLFRAGKLHSGSHEGPIVKNLAQARAIQINLARKEGYNIPLPPSDRKRNKRRKRAFIGRKSTGG